MMNVCIILDSLYRKHYEHDEIANLMWSEHTVSLVVVEDKQNAHTDQKIEPSRKSIFGKISTKLNEIIDKKWFILLEIERKIATYLRPGTIFQDQINEMNRPVLIYDTVPDLLGVQTIYTNPVRVGKYTYDFPNNVIERIKENCDIVILFGFNKILCGRILSAARHGVLSFHCADTMRYRGRPSGLHEWINNESFVGTTLQRLNEKLDGGEVILRRFANIIDASSHDEVNFRAMALKSDMAVEGIKLVEKNNCTFLVPKDSKLSTIKNSNRLVIVGRCLLKNIVRRYWFTQKCVE
jgi:folate-dependent phosphoribosylglycinamide formyltransferase PurN